MASVKLKFRLIRQNDKEGVIYYQIAHQRKIRRIYTDYKIRPCEWDDEKECITRPLPRYSRYRELLSIIEKVTRDMHLLQNIIMQIIGKFLSQRFFMFELCYGIFVKRRNCI